MTAHDDLPIAEFQKFLRAMRRIGYVDFITSASPVSLRIDRLQACSYAASPVLRPVLRLFLLGQEVMEFEVEERVRESIPLLVRLSLLRRSDGGGVRSCGFSLLYRTGLFFFVQILSADPFAYFGDDSIGLAMRLCQFKAESSLDLCAGSGLQGLLSARAGAEATLVEINPLAASLARVNATMNGLENVEILQGDLFDAVGDRRFDVVTANPPLLPVPRDVAYPFVGHGGDDGLAVTWRILQGLADHLSPAGHAQIVGSCLGTEQGPCPIDRLRAFASSSRLDVRMTCVGYRPFFPGAPFFKSLAATASLTSTASIEAIEQQFDEMRSAAGASRLYLFFLTVFPGDGRFEFMDLNVDNSPGQSLWFV